MSRPLFGSKYVYMGDRLVPRAAFTVYVPEKTPSCTNCGGLGQYPDSIDDERHDVMVPCPVCQEYCKVCGDWRRKGHQCGV